MKETIEDLLSKISGEIAFDNDFIIPKNEKALLMAVNYLTTQLSMTYKMMKNSNFTDEHDLKEIGEHVNDVYEQLIEILKK